MGFFDIFSSILRYLNSYNKSMNPKYKYITTPIIRVE
jgi:hypothetical protein